MKTLILAGGSGTRLFPLSRTCYPKQFIPLVDSESLFQKSVRRALIFSEPDEITIVTNELHRFLVADQLEEMHVTCHILPEPQGKNTLPAITYGITTILKEDPDARVAIISSDQLITPDESYKAAFLAAEKLAEKYLVTFGITPDSPHTGYGYIRPGATLDGGFAVDAFVEKPDQETAESYLRDGYLWNAGMFLFSAALFMDECRKHAPEVAEAFTLPAKEAFERTPKISVDYGIMEKTDIAAVVTLSVPWSDVGNFEALYSVIPKVRMGMPFVANTLASRAMTILSSQTGLLQPSESMTLQSLTPLMPFSSAPGPSRRESGKSRAFSGNGETNAVNSTQRFTVPGGHIPSFNVGIPSK